jgi:hypothetical protein
MVLMGMNGLDFVLFFALDYVRWWSQVVFSVFLGLDIRCKKQSMENRVYVPLGR